MKAWSVIGLLFTAAIIATMPISLQVTPLGVELGVNQAQAQVIYGPYRRASRIYRRGYYGVPGYLYYGAPAYFYYGAPGYFYRSRQPIGGGGGQWHP
jgi:hypothetical protein